MHRGQAFAVSSRDRPEILAAWTRPLPRDTANISLLGDYALHKYSAEQIIGASHTRKKLLV